MNDELFQRLLMSVQQADVIISGKADTARVSSFAEPEVKAVRAKIGLTQ